MHTPDKWVILEIESPDDKVRKILSSWYGGYAHGDSWRLSSGITEIEDKDDHYLIHNESGSIYQCFKESQGMNNFTASIFEEWLQKIPDNVRMEVVSITHLNQNYKD